MWPSWALRNIYRRSSLGTTMRLPLSTMPSSTVNSSRTSKYARTDNGAADFDDGHPSIMACWSRNISASLCVASLRVVCPLWLTLVSTVTTERLLTKWDKTRPWEKHDSACRPKSLLILFGILLMTNISVSAKACAVTLQARQTMAS